MEKILDVAKRRGFFWQSSLIHGPMAGFYDYAHLGTLLKQKWQDLWRGFFLGLDDNYYEIESCLIQPENVFKASGHLESFVDPIIKCQKCDNVERADQLLEGELGENFEGISLKDVSEMIKKHKIRCPECKGAFSEVGELNMMFDLNVGTGKRNTAYLLPETAQGAYLNFKLEFEALRKKLPLGLAIIGKAFRNEISPRNALYRMREFTQAELQIFFDPDKIKEHPRFKEVAKYKIRVFPLKNRKSGKIDEIEASKVVTRLRLPKFYVYHMAMVQKFYLDVLKFPKTKFRFRELSDEEKAFYNKFHFDVEANLESLGGFRELAGVHFRTDHDLKGHQRVSGISQEVNIDGKKVLANVLELSFGVDRNIYALFELAYTEEKTRTVLKFPRAVSPYDTGVFPLVNKDGLPEKAREVQRLLQENSFRVFFDSSGSIGRRYRRIDEIGCAAGLTIDYDSLKKDDLTLRDRDSMKQVRIKIKDLPEKLKAFLKGEKLEKLGKLLK